MLRRVINAEGLEAYEGTFRCRWCGGEVVLRSDPGASASAVVAAWLNQARGLCKECLNEKSEQVREMEAAPSCPLEVILADGRPGGSGAISRWRRKVQGFRGSTVQKEEVKA